MPRSIPMRWVSAAVMTTAAASAAIATPSAPFSTEALCPDTTGVWHPDTLTIEITLPDRKFHDLMVSKMDLHALDVLPFVVLANMAGFEINVVRIVDDEVSWQES